MEREELFTGIPVNTEHGNTDFEALGQPLIEYVVTELPSDLRAVFEETMTYEELALKHSALLEAADSVITPNTDPQIAKVTQLDLLFMLGSYLPLKDDAYRAAPPILFAAIQQQHGRFGLPDHMDYEMIVDVNFEETERHGITRLYTDKEFAHEERDFYLGHRTAEQHVKGAAYKIRSLVDNPDLMNTGATLEAASVDMKSLNEHMKAYAKMSTEAFTHLRRYIQDYPDDKKNASGAFMPSVQLLELALHRPTPTYTEFINASMPYFSEWSRPIIQGWHDASLAGHNLEAKIAGRDLELAGQEWHALSEVVKSFIDFRLVHRGVTFKQLREAFNNKDKLPSRNVLQTLGERAISPETTERTGSGGFDVEHLLSNGIVRLLNLHDRLEIGAS